MKWIIPSLMMINHEIFWAPLFGPIFNKLNKQKYTPKIRRDPSEGPTLCQIVALQVGQVHRSGVFQKIVAGFLPLFLLLLCRCIQHVTCDILLWIQTQMCQQVSHLLIQELRNVRR